MPVQLWVSETRFVKVSTVRLFRSAPYFVPATRRLAMSRV